MGHVSDEQQHDADGERQHDADALSRTRAKRRLLAGLLSLVIIVTTGLGIWQIERRAWKLALIAAVDARSHAPASAPPGPAAWPRVTAAHDAYAHVRVAGRFDHARETRVAAATGRGEGFWLLTPLVTPAGWNVLVNRGFRPAGDARPDRPGGPVVVTGLLRVSEPGGTLLRANDPAANGWYSRDVAAIAHARGLKEAAPYFIDADATPNRGGWPVGGLTVVAFRNAHLSYALTWFTLAGLSAWGLWFVLRQR